MGRLAVFMLIGFSSIFVFTGKNMNDVSVQAMDNALNYYENTQRYNIATAGANFACAQLFQDQTWRTGYSSVPFNGGTFTVVVTDLTQGKVQVVSTGMYQSNTQTVTIVLNPSSFSKFGFYGGTHASAAMWETGDTIGGPNHTQGKLKTYGSPVFLGKTTALNGVQTTGTGLPLFYGGFESGVNLPMPNNYVNISNASLSGYHQTGTDLYLNFYVSGGVGMVAWKTSPTGAVTNTALSTFAPNGVICVDQGNIHMQGTLQGKITVAALTTGTSGAGGQVYFDNSVVYATDPRSNPNSTDMLGVVSYKDMTVVDNGAATFNLNGSFYSYTGGLAVQNGTSRPAGMLNVYGGIIAEYLYATSNGATGTSRKGYNLNIRFDPRMANDAPPSFPATGSYEILSWYE